MREIFLIIDTYNGEGYSNSSIEVKEFHNLKFLKHYCKGLAMESEGEGEVKEMKLEGIEACSYGYKIGQDAGCISAVRYTSDIHGVILSPCVNDYTIVRKKDKWHELINLALTHGEDEDEVKEAKQQYLETGTLDHMFIHNGLGEDDALFYDISNEEYNIEYVEDKKDEEDIEIYKNIHTNCEFEVEVYKERKFDKKKLTDVFKKKSTLETK